MEPGVILALVVMFLFFFVVLLLGLIFRVPLLWWRRDPELIKRLDRMIELLEAAELRDTDRTGSSITADRLRRDS